MSAIVTTASPTRSHVHHCGADPPPDIGASECARRAAFLNRLLRNCRHVTSVDRKPTGNALTPARAFHSSAVRAPDPVCRRRQNRQRRAAHKVVPHFLRKGVAKLTYEYGKPLIGIARGNQRLFSGVDADWDTRWKPSEPEATATLWRYMSFAKFRSLLERRELFFALVGDMEDKYEGFISPPLPRSQEPHLHRAEQQACGLLHKIARTALVSCWTSSDHESALMWEAYAGGEGVAIRTTFRDLQESIRSIANLPITFGQVEYVDYRRQEVPRFCWAPLFHKRLEYRGEEELRVLLPGPPMRDGYSTHEEMVDIRLDRDVAKQRGRYIPVDLDILITEIVVPTHAPAWYTEVVNSAVQQSSVEVAVRESSISEEPDPLGIDVGAHV